MSCRVSISVPMAGKPAATITACRRVSFSAPAADVVETSLEPVLKAIRTVLIASMRSSEKARSSPSFPRASFALPTSFPTSSAFYCNFATDDSDGFTAVALAN